MEKLNEGDVFELVLDYLSTKGFAETERTLRKEKDSGGVSPPHAGGNTHIAWGPGHCDVSASRSEKFVSHQEPSHLPQSLRGQQRARTPDTTASLP